MCMSVESELSDIWQQAVDNADGAENYFYEREVRVNGVNLKFDVDLSTAIYYSAGQGGVDDLVYAKTSASDGASSQDIMDSKGEFINRVKEVAEDWSDVV